MTFKRFSRFPGKRNDRERGAGGSKMLLRSKLFYATDWLYEAVLPSSTGTSFCVFCLYLLLVPVCLSMRVFAIASAKQTNMLQCAWLCILHTSSHLYNNCVASHGSLFGNTPARIKSGRSMDHGQRTTLVNSVKLHKTPVKFVKR